MYCSTHTHMCTQHTCAQNKHVGQCKLQQTETDTDKNGQVWSGSLKQSWLACSWEVISLWLTTCYQHTLPLLHYRINTSVEANGCLGCGRWRLVCGRGRVCVICGVDQGVWLTCVAALEGESASFLQNICMVSCSLYLVCVRVCMCVCLQRNMLTYSKWHWCITVVQHFTSNPCWQYE